MSLARYLSGMIRNPISNLDPSWQQALRAPMVIALLTLLVVQSIAVVVTSSSGDLGNTSAGARLVELPRDQVTQIAIEAGDGDEVRLARGAEGWTLPELGGFAANRERVDALLAALAGLRRGLPVATSTEAQARLKVDKDGFERRLTLQRSEGPAMTIYLGESPGFRRLYLRLDGEDAIYDVQLADFEVSSQRDDWIDRDRLQLDAESITSIQAESRDGAWSLTKTEQGWQLDEDARALSPDAVSALTRSVANLHYQGVLAPEETRDNAQKHPVLTLKIRLANGERRDWTITEREEGDGYLLATAADSPVYRLSEYDLDGVLGVKPDTLVAQAEPEPTSEPMDAAASDDGTVAASGPASAPPSPEATPESSSPSRALSAPAGERSDRREPVPGADGVIGSEPQPRAEAPVSPASNDDSASTEDAEPALPQTEAADTTAGAHQPQYRYPPYQTYPPQQRAWPPRSPPPGWRENWR